jgi:hypothetical protein
LLRRLLHRTRLTPSLQFAITRLTGYAFIALGCYVALQLVGINLTSLAVIGGAIGIGLAFGLQNIVHNFVSGLIILGIKSGRLGELMEDDRKAGKLAKGARGGGKKNGPRGSLNDPRDKAPTLADQGVDKHLADRARKAAAIPEAKFEEQVARAVKVAVAATSASARGRTHRQTPRRQGKSCRDSRDSRDPDA